MAEGDYKVKAIVSADTSQFNDGMKKAQSSIQKTSKSVEGISKLLKSAFSVVGLGAGLKSIVDFGKASVQAAESANKSLNILNNTLKVTGATAWTTSEEMVQMSEKIAGSTNYTVSEVQDMQSVLLGFKNITEDTFESASVAITDMATVMGMDLKSAVQTVGKALDDPIKGLDSLKRQGFAFTEQQKDEMKILVENGKILEAQNMILEELNTTYGGAAIAAQSSFDKQKDALINLKETVGNQLLPIMDNFAEKSAETFGKLSEFVKQIDFASLAAGFEIAAETIKDIITTIWENFKELFSALEEVFGDGESLFDKWKDAAWDSFNNVYRIFQDVVKLITALIKGDWSVAWSYAKLTVLRMVDSVLDNLSKILNAFPKTINAIIQGINTLIGELNKIRSWLGQKEWDLVKPFESVDLSSLTGVENKIKEVESEIEKATGHAADKAIKDMDKVSSRREKYVKKSKKENLDLKTSTLSAVESSTSAWDDFFKSIQIGWEKTKEELKKKANDWSDVISSTISTSTEAFAEMFSMIGENLTGAGHGFRSFAAVALDALSDILKSLAAQLSAIALVKALTQDYVQAAAAAAGAAAALTAAGFASGISTEISKTKDEVKAIGEAADKSSDSLKTFMRRLEDIKNGVTSTSVRLVANVKAYKELTNSIKETIREKYADIDAERARIKAREDVVKARIAELKKDKEKTTDPTLDRLISNYNKELSDLKKQASDLEKEYNSLVSTLTESRSQAQKIIRDVILSYEEQIKSNKQIVESYNDIYNAGKQYYELLDQYNKLSAREKAQDLLDYATGSIESLTYRLIELRSYMQIVFDEQKILIQESLIDVYDTVIASGKTIGEDLVDGIINGATKKDFLTSMKDYIRENLIKLAVYTESFQDKLAQVGVNLTEALLTGGDLSSIRNQLDDLWEEASANAKRVEDVISQVFGDLEEIEEQFEETLEQAEEKLSSFEKAMRNFKEAVSDLGGDLASSLVEGISSGLNQSDFLDNMKQWIRKMLVQSVVYTQSMKSEIEAIGAAITKGLSEGFTETTFHEIRRDLSWVFDQANKTISGIDDILNSVFGGYATGTNNATSGLHLVGEAGPELIKFRGGEQVLNASNTNKALSGMGSKTINQSITFNNLKDTTAYAMMSQLKQYDRQMAINGVI